MAIEFSSNWSEKHTVHEPIFSMGFDITKRYFDFGISVSYIDMFMIYVNWKYKNGYFAILGFNIMYLQKKG